jgi:hypothetical protein
VRDEHESGTENRHPEAADEHIDTDEKEKNKFLHFPVTFDKAKSFFKDFYDDDKMHSGNCKNMAQSAFSESGGYFIFKFASGSDQNLFHKRGVPIKIIFIYCGRNLIPEPMDMIFERRIIPAGNFDWRSSIAANGNSSGTVFKELVYIAFGICSESAFAGNFVKSTGGVFVPTGKQKSYFLRRAFDIDRRSSDFINGVSASGEIPTIFPVIPAVIPSRAFAG